MPNTQEIPTETLREGFRIAYGYNPEQYEPEVLNELLNRKLNLYLNGKLDGFSALTANDIAAALHAKNLEIASRDTRIAELESQLIERNERYSELYALARHRGILDGKEIRRFTTPLNTSLTEQRQAARIEQLEAGRKSIHELAARPNPYVLIELQEAVDAIYNLTQPTPETQADRKENR